MSCDHDLDAAYLHPSDVEVMDVSGVDDSFRVDVAVPCPECDQALRLSLSVESLTETDLDLPLDDAEDVYD